MKDLYNKQFLFDTLFLLKSEIDDLSKWSVYNDDLLNEEIAALEKLSDEIRQKLIDLDKQEKLGE